MNAPAPIPSLVDHPIAGSLLSVRRDRFGFFLRVAEEHGGLVRARVGAVPLLIASSAELAHEALVTQEAAFMKGLGLSLFARPLLGDGLLTSEGDFHRRQRRMIAPAFVHKRIAEYADVIAARAEAAARGWGEALDLSAAMMRLTLEIVGKTLFDAEVGSEAAEIGEAITDALEHVTGAMTGLVPIPPMVPTPANFRHRKTIARLDETVLRLIRERRAEGRDKGDFLSMLLAAQDEDDKSTMSDRQVRDEAMNIFLAGHETTANALTWTFDLLAQHPQIRARLEREVDAALGGRTPGYGDLAKVPYALQVFKEAMRLYPPAPVIARRALRDVTIGGHTVKKGNLLLINVCGIHRRRAHYPEPHRFNPDRFTPEAEKALPRQAYMPFGAGPRICIGNHFALMEGHLVLATLAQRVRFEPLPGSRRLVPEHVITLRPKGGAPMRVVRREHAA